MLQLCDILMIRTLALLVMRSCSVLLHSAMSLTAPPTKGSACWPRVAA